MIRFLLPLLAVLAPLAAAPREVTIYVTSNLAGRFPLDQNTGDNHLMRIGAYLRAVRGKNPDALYLDAGNAFYPGRLSRFSFGSLTADYLQLLKLDAGLVASADLNIGADSLEYIRRARGIRLLSANLYREKSPFFEQYALLQRGGVKAAVVGLTSPRSTVSYAEAQLLDLRVEAADKTLPTALDAAATQKPDITIALSGLALGDAVALMAKHPRIDLVIAGGDAQSVMGGEPVRSIELIDGRRVVAMPPETTLMKFVLRKSGSTWTLVQRENIDVFAQGEGAKTPPSFLRRLSLWQKWYAAEEDSESASARFKPFKLTPQYAAAALRQTVGCDVAFVEREDIDTLNFSTLMRARDIRYAVQNDFDVLSFRLRGDSLRSFYAKNPTLVFSGMSETAITGYPIRDNVEYRICSTQRGYEIAMAQMEKRSVPQNQWLGLSDAVTSAVASGSENPDRSADRKFRLLTILNLSNTYETGRVTNGQGVDTPPGQAADSYFKWGLENDVNFILYNRRHAISFNPYIFYVRQKDQVIRNLLRGDITYTYNTEWLVKPYQKNRVDTVVVPDPTTGLRPSFLRETVGAEFTWKFITGRLGGGLEKEILDPVNDPNWGFEAQINALWEFYPGMKYKLGFDSFSSRTYQNFWRHRIEVGNSVIFTVADPLTFTISHRWYYFYLESVRDFYNSSILLLSLDLRTTWKYP